MHTALIVHALATQNSESSGAAAQSIDGVNAIFRAVAGLDKPALRDLSDSLKARMGSGVVVLASAGDDGKVGIVAAITPDLKGRVHAGNIVKALAPIVGGGGGGRPDFAEAGGKDASKIDAMLDQGRSVLKDMLAGATRA